MSDQFILETNKIRKEFGALVAVANVSIQVKQSSIHSIIGPNGAGKTTFFNLLSGNLDPTSGRVVYRGRDITKLPVHFVSYEPLISFTNPQVKARVINSNRGAKMARTTSVLKNNS